jgi:HPr kinase/phosphorylase
MKAIDHSPVHGTAIAVGVQGFLFLGRSGSGKSGLALQMMALGATLIADDQVILESKDNQISMRSPETLLGQIEARNLGILKVQTLPSVCLAHVVDLDAETTERMPEFKYCEVLGVRFDLINGRNIPNLASSLIILGRSERHAQ